jgi:hypothetical protein
VKPVRWPRYWANPRFCSARCAAYTATLLAGEFFFCVTHKDWWDRTLFEKCPRCVPHPDFVLPELPTLEATIASVAERLKKLGG